MDTNGFNGNLLPCVGTMSNLKEFYIFGNDLTGNIPTEIGNLHNLEKLAIEDNDLTGSIIDTGICALRRDNVLTEFVADCAGNNPEIICPSDCCTKCCSSTQPC